MAFAKDGGRDVILHLRSLNSLSASVQKWLSSQREAKGEK